LTLGFYANFPSLIHWIESFTSTVPNKQLQHMLMQLFCEINRKEFSFEEIANPTIPGGKITFNFGFAEVEGFEYIDWEESKKILDLLTKEQFHTVDFICGIRYHKENEGKKIPLKFDYYFIRTIYNRGNIEIQIHHDRGPRYISPQDLTSFIINRINDASKRKVLKKSSP
jgi:hypothetical protein